MRLRLSTLVASALVAGALTAQEPAPAPPAQDDAADEMMRLFQEVEEALREIDLLLSDAAAGDTSLAEVPDSGLDKLLEVSQLRSRTAVQGIDRILEIAQSQSQSSSSGSSTNSPPPQDSPLDEQRPEENRDREETPQGPQQEEPNQEPQNPDQPDPGEERPDERERATDEEGRNREGSEDEHPSGARNGARGSVDVWGELPTRVRQVFRTEGGQDLPVQYRDWIDAYYRKLNETRNP